MRRPLWLRDEPVELTAEVLSEHGPVLRCRVAGQIFEIARAHVQAGSEVAHTGDRGTLVVPRWVAVISGLTVAPSRRSFGRV